MEKLVLAPYVTVGLQNEVLYVGFGSIQFKVTGPEDISRHLQILCEFKSPSTVTSVLRQHKEWDNAGEIIEKIQKCNMLIPDARYDDQERWSRQNLFFELSGISSQNANDTLSSKKIAIIGCGGIGNQVSVHLATAGVRQFVLCDADIIEQSNLSRQILFSEEDVGSLKTRVLARELKKRMDGLRVRCIEKHIFSSDDLAFCRGADFIVVSADKGGVVNAVNRFCVQNKIPYINVGYVNDIAVWGPLYVPEVSGCYSCQDIIANDKSAGVEIKNMIRKINEGYQAPSVGPVNMISSGMASADVLKFLVGAHDKVHSINRRIGLWTHNLKIEEQNCSKNPICQVCGRP